MAQENPFARLFTKPLVWLAQLQPGPAESPIEISLGQHNPEDTHYYVISYDRSESQGKIEIQVNGEGVEVPKPLEDALRSLRDPLQPRILWADLLIGRTPEERSAQAKSMRTILENADKTIAWLGTSSEQSSKAFDVILTLSNRWNQACLHSGMPERLAEASAQHIISAREKFLSYPAEELHPNDAELWNAVRELFSSSYFQCVQSIPDIVLSKNAVITLGTTRSMPWTDFVAASRAWPIAMAALLQQALSEEAMSAIQLINNLAVAEWRQRTQDGVELLPMIQSCRDCTTSDPREYVFSMLPIVRASKRVEIAGDRPQPALVVDYSKTVQEVFKEAAKYVVQERQDFLLNWCERPPCGRRVTGLPSWVPDWSTPLPTGGGGSTRTKNGLRAWTDAVTSRKQIYVDDDFGLHVQANALDRVSEVSEILTEDNCRRFCLKQWQKLNVPGHTQLAARYESLWRTLIVNDGRTFGATLDQPQPAPAELKNGFDSLLGEERMAELVGCTTKELSESQELQQRAMSLPEFSVLAPLMQKSQPYVALLVKNTVGRRFFRTVNGRMGMTAVESRVPTPGDENNPPVPNFDGPLGDPLGSSMMQMFQQHLQQNNPEMARALAQGIRGEFPTQAAPGVRINDIIVAIVGGFQPYVLRPLDSDEIADSQSNGLQSDSKYRYVGDCYLHGAMEGELLQSTSWFGRKSWRNDIQLADITII